ncbi:MAG: twin-arginine translocation signal domain-containing protein [Bacteroidales bacterium]|nr:twin-arginine translocation signal domain-containing protein [Bacteroidales bacterium]
MNRRTFIKGSALATASLGFNPLMASPQKSGQQAETSIPDLKQSVEVPDGNIRALLIQLGEHMWCDWPTVQMGDDLEKAILGLPESRRPSLKLGCDYEVWKQVTEHAAKKGVNVLVIDLGEALYYPSHPELAVEGTWSTEKMQQEIRRLNALGMEVLPKLNFSCTHNGWLKDYRHMVSSKPYYKVCEEVIADAYKTFGNPRFFHIGYDEEDEWHRDKFFYRVQRVEEAWWLDFLHIVHTVEKLGARPWAWSDYGWDHPDYFTRCPKSVIQQNWYYDEQDGGFDPATNNTSDKKRLVEYWNLEKAGFDQIPCGTNWVGYGRAQHKVGADDVIGKLVKLGKEVVSKEHLKGFMMATWDYPCDNAHKENLMKGIDLFAKALE